MLRRIVTVSCVCVAYCVAGCSSGQVENSAACTARDWPQLGQLDGRQGVSTKDRNAYFDRCRDEGVDVDLASYQAGRSDGLELYCTTENGFDVGRRGELYAGVCPPFSESAFLEGYDDGRAEYALLSDDGSAESDVSIGVGIGGGFGGGRHRNGLRTGIGVSIGRIF